MRAALCLLTLSLAGACSPQADAVVPSADRANVDTVAPGSAAASATVTAVATPSLLPPAASADPAPVANDPKLHPVLLAIAQQYDSFARVDGTYWSQLDCMAPPDDPAHMSSAAEGRAHGRKVFVLRVFDFDSYAKETGGRPPGPSLDRIGKGQPVPGTAQVLVKVSYEPTEDLAKSRVSGVAPASHQGKTYYPGEQKDLFVMYRPTDKNAATDRGWLYGTVSPDGKRVSSAGLVKSCVGCHEKAPYGRQFGVK